MKILRTLSVLVVSVIFQNGPAEAKYYRTPDNNGQPDCPLNRPPETWPENMWQDWFLNHKKNYNQPHAGASVRFQYWPGFGIHDSEKYKGDGDPFGNIYPKDAYLIYYKNGRWNSMGYNEQAKENRLWEDAPGYASPEKYQLSIFRRVFTFNEKGEVFDSEYGRVGQIVCRLGGDSF